MVVTTVLRSVGLLTWRSKSSQIALLGILLLSFYIVYTYRASLVSESTRRRQIESAQHQKVNSVNLLSLSHGINTTESDTTDTKTSDIDVIITFTNVDGNFGLREKFRTAMRSLFAWSSVHVRLHVLGDTRSAEMAARVLADVAHKHMYTLVAVSVEEVSRQVGQIIQELQAFFIYEPGAYYSDPFFFLSIISHRIFPHLHTAIMIDADLKFNADLKDLVALFHQFSKENVLGIGRELQPTYRHSLYQYRKQNKGTRAGDPPPHGLTGFNSGVLLLNYDKMRASTLYNSLISKAAVQVLTRKYMFKGHLGDQDFFTLISLEHEELFYTLPCTWNRQLCQWWAKNGYQDVAEQYAACEGHINIFHGNCNTDIPTLDFEKQTVKGTNT